MDVPLQRSGAIGRTVIALGLCLCGASQAGMQVQPPPAEPAPKVAPAPAPATPTPTAPKPRIAAGPVPSTAQRQNEKAAWSPCLRLINAAALGAEIDTERRQALLAHCAS